ncbi:MAG: HEAT repeat domain-containing protein [Terriglobales bacterium]
MNRIRVVLPGLVCLTLTVGLLGQDAATAMARKDQQAQALTLYQQALSAANQLDWKRVDAEMAQAQKLLAQVDSSKAQGALYWQAYAASQRGERLKAARLLGALQRQFPDGTWGQDAEALRLQLNLPILGQPLPPATQEGDDLKLLALNGLINTEPVKVLPLLQDVINGHSDASVKDRALFVLAQDHSPAALADLVNAAEHNTDPAVRMRALRYLGLFGGQQSQTALEQIYRQTNVTAVKESILRDYMLSGDTGRLIALAESETNPQLHDQAIRELGLSDKPAAQAALVEMYQGARDRAGSEAIIQALFLHRCAPALVGFARKESDPELKRDLVQMLSLMHSPAATAYLMELLKQ